jgi:hypothetical protein
MFYEIWPLNKSDCKEYDNEFNETILYCNFNLLPNQINDINNLIFVFDGIGYEIKNEDLFEKINENFFVSLIKFRKEKNNIWTMGFPFLKNFDLMLDYENKKIGIKNNNNNNNNNNNIFNYTEDYLKWKKENENFLNININDKKIMIAGMIIGSLVLICMMIWIIRKCIKNNINDNNDNNNNNNNNNNKNNNNKNNNVKKKGNHVELVEEV